MSESTRQQLASTLSSLNNEDKAWIINFLVRSLLPLPPKRKARKKCSDEMTDEQWEEYFDHQSAVPLPEETMPADELYLTSGKTIKQIEKWL